MFGGIYICKLDLYYACNCFFANKNYFHRGLWRKNLRSPKYKDLSNI